MSSTSIERPFYLYPPWSILFDFRKLEKLTPWNINIAYLLTTFLEEMEKADEIDFRASGVALDSSALIYLMKSKLLLKLEEPPLPPKPTKDFLPPPLFLPLRHELTSTTIKHLLEALDEALKGGKPLLQKESIQEPVLPDPSDVLPQVDLYLREIEQQMEQLYALLSRQVKGAGIIEFSTLIKDKMRLEAIRTFILLLFLVQDTRIDLWQDEETEEIYIAIGEMGIAESRDTII